MASSSRKLANIKSTISSRTFFLVIFLQIPLFRVPCGSGVCTTPMQVISSQLIELEVLPPVVVKGLLYPGAIANAVINNTTLPSFNNLLSTYNSTNPKSLHEFTDVDSLEILAGSYFSTVGALLGLLKPGRLSLFGTLLVIWGLLKEVILGNIGSRNISRAAAQFYPTMFIAVISAFTSIKSDVRKLISTKHGRSPLISQFKLVDDVNML